MATELAAHEGGWCAFARPGGAPVVGLGPFVRVAEPPAAGVAFYANDFSLGEEKPWLVPSEVLRDVELVDDLGELEPLTWHEPEVEAFAGVFSEVMAAVEARALDKSVPVVAERAVVGDFAGKLGARAMVRSLRKPLPYYGYGMSLSDGVGMAGATPELLAYLRKGRLHTMALAGTARIEEKSVFAVDEKEIREHEYVVSQLEAQLQDVGMVRRESRRMMELERIVHFHTPLYIELYRNEDARWVIEQMHPTPALGPLPRNAATMQQLLGWREKLRCPSYFGAPFGLWDRGHFHCVVAIRGVHWSADEVVLPSGCGVIRESRLLNEWRELRLKRDAVRGLLG